MKAFLLILILVSASVPCWSADLIPENQLVLKKNNSPLIAFRVAFLTGSAYDPPGKEGAASLTASLLEEGSTQKYEYQQILQLLYPMAAGYGSQVDKEMTVFIGVTHRDHLDRYYELFRDAILQPAFKQDEFERVKTDQLNYVVKSLRFNNDEELGKEALNWALFKGHPYGRPNEGTASGVRSLTIEDVRNFYRNEYTRENIVIGIAGNYPDSLIQNLRTDFASLPQQSSVRKALPPAPKVQGIHVLIVEKKTAATAISFGYPVPFTRTDQEFYPMAVMNSWLGQHRTQVGRLYNVMREARGMNYGDYSYIEHFAFGGTNMQPPPNYPRHQQIFQVWIRPVPHAMKHFALRQAVREVEMLDEKGLTQKDLQTIREFLLNYSVSLAQSNSEMLGYALDDRFYQLNKSFLDLMKDRLNALTLDQVNSAIRKHLSTKNMAIVVVTEDASVLKKALVENSPSAIQYDSPKPDAIVQEDKVIMNFPLAIRDENVTIVPVEKMFE